MIRERVMNIYHKNTGSTDVLPPVAGRNKDLMAALPGNGFICTNSKLGLF